MPAQGIPILAFNRGLVSRLGLARADIKRVALSAEEMTNFVPRVLGSMMLRPGLGYLGSTASDAAARCIPFVFSISDKALIEFTDSLMRVWISDALVTRSSVSSAVTNGNFTSDVTSWTDNDEAGGTSAWVTGGYMGLTGNGTAAAIRDQTVTVAAADQNVEHALRIVVQRGPVTLRVGTGTTDDSYVSETELQTGTHSLAFTPTGDFNIRFLSRLKRQVLVDSCNVEASGTMTLPTPYGASDLSNIRYDQSGDVIFVACVGYTQRRIERRATRSWSVVQYLPSDGPFGLLNTGPITLTPGALSGNTTLTASAPLFKSTHAPSTNNAGALFRVSSSGQSVTQSITAQNTFTNAIRVTGVDAQRVFTVTITEVGAGANTFTLQRSLDSDTGPWTDVQSWTVSVTTTYDDTLDNQIAWYRLGIKTGDYGSDTHTVTLTYTVGSIDGVCRVTGFTSSTVVSVEVLDDFGGTSATDDWYEGEWSDRKGWPSATGFYEGRLGWAGKDGVWLTVSDAFASFDDTTEGDSGPIARTIGSGPVDTINWMLPLQRLILGGQGAEFSARSSSLDEPLTPTNFNLKTASTQGSAGVGAVVIDSRGIFVQRGGVRVYDLAFGETGIDYESTNLSALVPSIGSPQIVRMAVQRQPDTRVHFVRSDGTVALLVFDKIESVICWSEIETLSGDAIEDVCVIPGDAGEEEDKVYYVVKRTVNGSTKRFLEKWAKESECVGGAVNKQADSFVTYSGVAATSIPVAHLEGETVVAWTNGTCPEDANGDPQTYTVSSGAITLSTATTSAVVGLPYTARWKSSKLARFEVGIMFGEYKNIKGLALLLADTHRKGIKFGPDFDNLDDLPSVEEGAAVSADTVHTDYEQPTIPFPGLWESDARLCLQAESPRPATVLGVVPRVTT